MASLLMRKYRPQSIDEIVGHDGIKEWFRQWIDRVRVREMPHVLLYGPPGVGKTCFAEAFFKDLIRSVANGKNGIEKMMGNDYLELNASDDRGINVIREQIKAFASRHALNPTGVKIVFLDEADSMTTDAYECLRRIMEDFPNTKFIMSLNNVGYVHPAIRDRAVCFYVRPLSVDELVTVLRRVVEGEGWVVDESVLRRVAEVAGGSARRGINLLQSIIVAGRVSKELYASLIEDPFKRVEDVLRSAHSPYHLVLLLSHVPDDELITYIQSRVAEDEALLKLLEKYGWRDWEAREIKRAKLIRILWLWRRGVNQ